MTLAECARKAGLNVRSLQRRIKRGMTIEEAMTAPKRQRAEHCQILITIGRRTMCAKDWCREIGLGYSTFHLRVSKGMTPREALLAYNVRNRTATEQARRDRIRSVELGGSPCLIQGRRSANKTGKSRRIWTEEEIVNTPPVSMKARGRRIREERMRKQMGLLGCVV